MKRSAALAALLLAACSAPDKPPAISVDGAWARATASGQSSTAIYMTISNDGGADRLLGVSTPAGQASVHSTSMDGGIMRMRSVEGADVPAESALKLELRGLHVMVTNLRRPLVEGTTVPVELRFERSGEKRLEVPVRAAGGNGATM